LSYNASDQRLVENDIMSKTTSPSAIDSLRGDNEVLRLRLQSAHAEVELLRAAIRRLADQDATLSVCDGNVTVTMDATLTDEERAAIQWFAHYGLPERYAATLRALLERLK
jgi:transcriptional regulator GlxA family with amidase domain